MDIFLTLVNIGKADGFCYNTANIWQLIGYVVLAFKIVIPILLIVFGMIDLGKAVIAGKQDEVKKNVINLVWRIIAGIIIFLIPTLISLIMSFVGNFGDAKEDYEVCRKCITSPGKNACDEPAGKAWGTKD